MPVENEVNASTLPVLYGTFSERLRQVRENKGLSQSELAREVWGETVDRRGYTVAKNRDRVSAYEGNRAKPTPKNLTALANVLGIDEANLAPDIVSGRAFDEPTPAIELRVVGSGTFIKVNAKVSAEVALEIVALLQREGIK
mgnify:FL=1